MLNKTYKKKFISKLINKNIKLCIAESLTGGALAAEFIRTQSASKFMDFSIVCYSNQSKKSLLNLGEKIKKYDIVSSEIVESMAKNVLKYSKSKKVISLACTGLASTSNDYSKEKVGNVFICVNYQNLIHTKKIQLGRRSRKFIIDKTIDFIIKEANSII